MQRFREGIHGWISAASEQAIWADQDGKLPERQFCAVKITGVRREGAPTYFPIDGDGNQPILQGAILTVSVSVFGGATPGAALDKASALAGSLNRVTVKDRLRSKGLAFVDLPLSPSDVTRIVGTTNEPRAVFDARFRVNLAEIDPVGWIETSSSPVSSAPGTSCSP
ncbi:MAG: hypothetical protein DI556_09790 [Rhodovulum sulfidophilum]|uniref:Phage neck terminator protein gp12-like domain-containing protein n=1 Tax=Rhodovulum sulfidophilum TaxID=35806 RepID=A0A2W5Q4W5_RHOSU|nr:MAG: hypothetical protein DI556_09790 [Rhodovulum sulfidophilum]